MGQIEIYEFLKNQRLSGNESFFSVQDIYKGLKETPLFNNKKSCLYSALIQLERFEYVEVKMKGSKKGREWFRTFRLKKKYCVLPKS